MKPEKRTIDGTEFVVIPAPDWGTYENVQKKNEALIDGIKQKIGTLSIDEVIEAGISFKRNATTQATAQVTGTQIAGTQVATLFSTGSGFDPNSFAKQIQEAIGNINKTIENKLNETIGNLKTEITLDKVKNLANSRGLKIDDMFIKVEPGKNIEQILTEAEASQKAFLERIGVKLEPGTPGKPGEKRDLNALTNELKKAVDAKDVTKARKIRTQIEMLKMKGNI